MSQNHTGDCTLAHYAAIARNRNKHRTALPQWCNLEEGWDKRPDSGTPKKEHAEHDSEKDKKHDAEHGNKPGER